MVDGINSNQSSEIYKKQNTKFDSSPSWLAEAKAEIADWEANLPVSSDEENLTYDTTGMDLNNLNLDNLDTEPSGWDYAIQLASTAASGLAQILSALNPAGGDGSSSSGSGKVTDLESAMKACQVDNPKQSDVTTLGNYITKAQNKLNDELSATGKNAKTWNNAQQALALDIAQKGQNITNIKGALGGMAVDATKVEANIDGVNQEITANDEAVRNNITVINKYDTEIQEGESNLHRLGEAVNKAHAARDAKQDEINKLVAPDPNKFTKEVQETDSNGKPVTKTVPDTKGYNEAKAKYDEEKAKKENELKLIKDEIAKLESCIQVGNQRMDEITAAKTDSENHLDKLQENVTGLKDKNTVLADAEKTIKERMTAAKTSQTDAEKAKAQAEREKEKAEKELTKLKQKEDEIIGYKNTIQEAIRIRDTAQAKINGTPTPDNTAKTPGTTGNPPVPTTTTSTPGATTTGTPSTTTTGNDKIYEGGELPGVTVTGSPMKAVESKQVTAKDGSTVTLTKNANGTYDITGLKDGDQKGITAKDLYKFLED